ncbi:hypothetical protein PG997_011672 [Apiospora hydei]|uniref:PRELI/MSF1 domain-containing protein n=1 Tax=Apiospora hydei TaxID=1337664 RepID=A0ABR1VJQ8_9PEZI
MVLTHTTNHSYTHPFPTVTLAFFLRYYSPQLNPFSAHVLSTDTIDSHVDPETGRLHTTRIHLKKSRMPSAIIKLLPASVTGGAGEKSSYVLENSIVDIKEGWMKTESRNLNFTGVLSVTESQHYSATPPTRPTTRASLPPLGSRKTDKAAANEENSRGRFGWISGWGAKRIQSSIESIASNKTDDQIIKSRDGMKMVLERLRSNGVVAVLRELNRREGKSVFEA